MQIIKDELYLELLFKMPVIYSFPIRMYEFFNNKLNINSVFRVKNIKCNLKKTGSPYAAFSDHALIILALL